MIVLHINEDLSSRLEQKAASAGMSAEAYAHELMQQAVEEADDLDIAFEEYQQGGKTYSQEEVKRELGLGS